VDLLILEILGKDNPGVVGLGQTDSLLDEPIRGTHDENADGGSGSTNAAEDAAEASGEANDERSASSFTLTGTSSSPTAGAAPKRGPPSALTLRQIKKDSEEAKKKKMKLKNEGFESQNYKTRLEILRLERDLNLPKSKNTSSVVEYDWQVREPMMEPQYPQCTTL